MFLEYSETNASEFPQNLEKMFSLYYMYSDKFNMFKLYTIYHILLCNLLQLGCYVKHNSVSKYAEYYWYAGYYLMISKIYLFY